MQIETIKQTDLTQSEREVLKEDGERWKRIGGGSHLDEWLSFLPGLMIRRTLAMRIAHTNQAIGKLYSDAFAELMRADGMHTMDKTSVTAVLWLGDDPERMKILRDMRDAMTPGRRSRMNSPISARQQVEKIIKARETKGGEEKLKTSPVALLKEQIMEQAKEIAMLQTKLAKADEGSLFDLKHDKADDIAVAIVNSVSENKAKAIATSIGAWFKSKQKPAG
jgi:hypothetical protein